MNRKFENLLSMHEEADSKYIYDKYQVLQKVAEEFENKDDIIDAINKDENFAQLFFDYSKTPELWPIIPIRTSDALYLKKHTATQRKYFHNHTFYEVIYVCKGKCVQQFYPTMEKIVLNSNQVCIITPGLIHALNKSNRNDIIIKVVIPSNVIEDNMLLKELFEKKKLHIFKEISPDSSYTFFKFTAEYYKNDKYSKFLANNLIQLFIVQLFRECKLNTSKICERLKDYLRDSIKTASLKDFAKILGYTTDYVGRQIKKYEGHSFLHLLAETRLEKAKTMLKDSELSVENIAKELGFRNTSGFYKLFCLNIGMTPNEYRKAYKEVF